MEKVGKTVGAGLLGALVLGAGKGTRLYSSRPKVLQELLGVPMLGYVYEALEPVAGGRIWTVVGFGAQAVAEAFPSRRGRFVLQEPQLGTGHALSCAWSSLKEAGLEWCLVVNGDTPLVTAPTLQMFVSKVMESGHAFGFISLTLRDPGSYGRVVRAESGRVRGIIEARDFDSRVHGADVGEINAGIYLFRLDAVERLLSGLSCDNAQNEFYITQLVDLLVADGGEPVVVSCGQSEELLGVNTAGELVRSEEVLRRQLVHGWIERGVLIRQQESVRIGPNVDIAPGVHITGPCEIYGESRIESGAVIESHCWMRDAEVGKASVVRAFSHIESGRIGGGCVVGPYARLRPGAELERDVRVGNFVEIKKSRLAAGAKVNHLSYIGDSSIGERTNVGAGTITCNYDGTRKHRTVIGEEAFIGSNTALIAPVTIGERALIGAGSTITKDVPPDTLAVSRSKQTHVPKKNR